MLLLPKINFESLRIGAFKLGVSGYSLGYLTHDVSHLSGSRAYHNRLPGLQQGKLAQMVKVTMHNFAHYISTIINHLEVMTQTVN